RYTRRQSACSPANVPISVPPSSTLVRGKVSRRKIPSPSLGGGYCGRPMRSLIETERLSLGLPEPADAGAIVAYYRENRAHLEPWSPTWPAGFFTEEFWRDQARSARQDFRAGTAVRMII